jgi:catechol 2,3-dioxygenase-like lactoylglutathione lyase family enzyme
MIEGVSHITFIVEDLERASAFFRSLFDAEEVYSSGDRTFSVASEKFLLVGGQWIALMEGDPPARGTYDHVAFKIPEGELGVYESRIRALGLETRAPRSRVEGEGRSRSFYDYDNHLFELHTGTLAKRLARYTRR